MVIFAVQNVISDPPFTKVDIISCRNCLFIMNRICRRILLSLFHYSLNPEGLLILGTSETTGSQSHLYRSCGLTIQGIQEEAIEQVRIIRFSKIKCKIRKTILTKLLYQ